MVVKTGHTRPAGFGHRPPHCPMRPIHEADRKRRAMSLWRRGAAAPGAAARGRPSPGEQRATRYSAPMPRENVEIVRRAFESFNRRDLAGAVVALEPEAEWVPYLAALEQEVYRGRGDIERMWREVLTAVPDLRIELVKV